MPSFALHLFLVPVVISLAGVIAVFGSPRNITVDDNDPAVVYSPVDDWSFGLECSTCTVHLDASQVYQATWHETLFSSTDEAEDDLQTISYNFTGTAIYVYGILSNANDGPSGNADQKFFIDNRPVGTFQHTPDGTGSFVYSALLYSNSSLQYGPHTLIIQNGQQGDLSSLLMLDYLVYSTPNIDAPASTSGQPSPLISPSPAPSTRTDTPSASAPASNKHATTIILAVLLPVLALLLALQTTRCIRYRHRLRLRGLPAQPCAPRGGTNVPFVDQDPQHPPLHKSWRMLGGRFGASVVPAASPDATFSPTTTAMANVPSVVTVSDSPDAARTDGARAEPADDLVISKDHAPRYRASQQSDRTLTPDVSPRQAAPAGAPSLARSGAVSSAGSMSSRRWSPGTELPSYEEAQRVGCAPRYYEKVSGAVS